MERMRPGQPAYVQIATVLRGKITSGDLEPGAMLPSARELETTYSVSNIVARQAINVLKAEGLVYGVKGKGSFVSERRQLVRVAPARYGRGKASTTWRMEANTAAQHIERDYNTVQTQASEDVAQRLGIEPGEGVSSTEYFFKADGIPVTWSTAWEPLELTKGTPIEWPEEGEHGHRGIVDRFDSIGQRAVEVEEELVVRMPAPHEARKLEIADQGVPLVEIRQTFRTTERAIEVASIIYPADRYRFVYRMPIPDHEG